MGFKDKEVEKAYKKKWLLEHPNYQKERSLRRNNSGALKLDRIKNPDKYRNQELKRNFNLTLEEYNIRLKLQGNRCAACGREVTERLMVDHDHNCCPNRRGNCGKCNRGLLCNACNSALGFVQDSIPHLEQLIGYLQVWNG